MVALTNRDILVSLAYGAEDVWSTVATDGLCDADRSFTLTDPFCFRIHKWNKLVTLNFFANTQQPTSAPQTTVPLSDGAALRVTITLATTMMAMAML